jgi:hypothetical protein
MLLLGIGRRLCDRDRMAYPFVLNVNLPPRPANSSAGQSVLSVLLKSFKVSQSWPKLNAKYFSDYSLGRIYLKVICCCHLDKFVLILEKKDVLQLKYTKRGTKTRLFI